MLVVYSWRLLQSTKTRAPRAAYSRRGGISAKFAATGALNLILWVFMSVLVVFYIIQVTQSAARGYSLKTASERVEQLKKDNKRLEIGVASQKSIAVLKSDAETIGMVPVNDVLYVRDATGAVARR